MQRNRTGGERSGGATRPPQGARAPTTHTTTRRRKSERTNRQQPPPPGRLGPPAVVRRWVVLVQRKRRFAKSPPLPLTHAPFTTPAHGGNSHFCSRRAWKSNSQKAAVRKCAKPGAKPRLVAGIRRKTHRLGTKAAILRRLGPYATKGGLVSIYKKTSLQVTRVFEKMLLFLCVFKKNETS